MNIFHLCSTVNTNGYESLNGHFDLEEEDLGSVHNLNATSNSIVGRKIKSIADKLHVFSKFCEVVGLLAFVLQLVYYYKHFPLTTTSDALVIQYNVYQSTYSVHNTVFAVCQLLLIMRTYMTLRKLPGMINYIYVYINNSMFVYMHL